RMTPAPGSRDSSAAAAAAAREDGHAAAEKENQVPGKMTDPHNRIISGKALDDDARIEASIRPTKLSDYIGQNRVKENLQIAVEAARTRGEALDHVLLYGPPGLGKTTLAQILAHEMGSAIKVSSGPLLEKKGDLTAVLTSLEKSDFFFLDEIHRLQPSMEEILYPAMEDFRVDLIIGQGPGARVHPYQLNRFTLIGATTRAGLIMAPLRSRFGIVHRLDFYSPEDLLRIVQRSAKILGITMDESGAAEIARRSRGTPRVANRLLRRVRDFAEVRAKGHIDLGVARDALAMLGVDEHGLDEVDRNLLLTIIQKYSGGPVGLNTLAASLSEEEDAIEEIYEPYLMQLGLLDRTQRGRVATALAYKHFGMDEPRRQPGLFS
ncbi:MAG: Holliday junction branch migration DNA helicase RuvB, partial [Candidatus Acidiferrales bacterium]